MGITTSRHKKGHPIDSLQVSSLGLWLSERKNGLQQLIHSSYGSPLPCILNESRLIKLSSLEMLICQDSLSRSETLVKAVGVVSWPSFLTNLYSIHFNLSLWLAFTANGDQTALGCASPSIVSPRFIYQETPLRCTQKLFRRIIQGDLKRLRPDVLLLWPEVCFDTLQWCICSSAGSSFRCMCRELLLRVRHLVSQNAIFIQTGFKSLVSFVFAYRSPSMDRRCPPH